VLANRINLVAGRLISNNQSAFIKGRYILESVVTAHEVIHSVNKSSCSGVVLKLHYEKPYDKVNWDFPLDVLNKRGFGRRWVSWIRKILHNGSVGVQINNSEGNYFETGKGLRQGDPLSPILFNIMVDVLTKMLAKAAEKECIRGLGVEFISRGVISLEHADDTILFLENDLDKARNTKMILTLRKCLG
jgi:retron-type reverse transcriptase